jgi:uncharacterized protein YcbK (DUF882 family)
MRPLQRLIFVALFACGCWQKAEARGSAAGSASASPKPIAVPSAAPAPPAPDAPSVFTRLSPLKITNANSHETRSIRLYDAQGRIDEAAAKELDQLLCDARDKDHVETRTIDRRTLQLFFRAAYHFNAVEAEVISAYRKPGRHREGLHAEGRAIDFKLAGVKAADLASYLRKQPRVGVGVYTHPKTQYVHLDVRDMSFHWLDASPPRRRWREKSLGRIPPEHDAAYTPSGDWPEGTTPPSP